MKKHSRKFTLRLSVLAFVTVGLIASATTFMMSSAEENVSPTDVSVVSQSAFRRALPVSKVSGTDTTVSGTDTSLRSAEPKDYYDPDLNTLLLTMTTSKDSGENVEFTYSGSPITKVVEGQTIRLYGDNLNSFICHDQNLTSLTLGDLPNLSSLDCYNNELTSLTLGDLPNLSSLDCHNNELTSLTLGNLPNLSNLDCRNNELTSLDLSHVRGLAQLRCGSNKLTSLDLSYVHGLMDLGCEKNQLTSLDVSHMSELVDLGCEQNQLTSLDVSDSPHLRRLHCHSNQLTSITLGNPSNLSRLDCSDNRLRISFINKLVQMNPDFASDSSFTYNNQHDIPITPQVSAGEFFTDLSSEYMIDGASTVFNWYMVEGDNITSVEPTKSSDGRFMFNDQFVGKKLFCAMTNPKYPDFLNNDEGTDFRARTRTVIVVLPNMIPDTTQTGSGTVGANEGVSTTNPRTYEGNTGIVTAVLLMILASTVMAADITLRERRKNKEM